MRELISAAAAAVRTGQPARRIREWCATGKLECERNSDGWLIPSDGLDTVRSLGAERDHVATDHHVVALALPAPAEVDVAAEIARRLRLPPSSVSLGRLAIDGREYVVAVWRNEPDVDDLTSLATLADEFDGELLDGMATGS
ncbi:MAG TPA: hypothetical protein VFI28_04940 [Candidatus Limnocylindrales bacterium]|nr:hypothetical protein [Candidatus Limnocylindrales bacterium]